MVIRESALQRKNFLKVEVQISRSPEEYRHGKFSNHKQFSKDKLRSLMTLRSFSSMMRAVGNHDRFFKPNDVIGNTL